MLTTETLLSWNHSLKDSSHWVESLRLSFNFFLFIITSSICHAQGISVSVQMPLSECQSRVPLESSGIIQAFQQQPVECWTVPFNTIPVYRINPSGILFQSILDSELRSPSGYLYKESCLLFQKCSTWN